MCAVTRFYIEEPTPGQANSLRGRAQLLEFAAGNRAQDQKADLIPLRRKSSAARSSGYNINK
jgi:hypothetical protein